jgi:hypothetical protein
MKILACFDLHCSRFILLGKGMERIQRTKRSIERFAKFFLSIRDTPLTFHQTLTFPQPQRDAAKAQSLLNRLLKSIEKKFPSMAALYVQERQENQGVHFHVRFYFFPARPLPSAQLERNLRRAVFNRWDALTGGGIVRQGNWLRVSKDKLWSLHYLLQKVEPVRSVPKQPGQPHWWGCRNKAILEQNAAHIQNVDVLRFLEKFFLEQKRPPRRPRPPDRYTRRWLAQERAYLEAIGFDWQGWKYWKTLKANCTDIEYLAHLNGKDIHPHTDDASL